MRPGYELQANIAGNGPRFQILHLSGLQHDVA